MARNNLCQLIFFMNRRWARHTVAIAVMVLCLISQSQALWAETKRTLQFDEFLMEATFRIVGKGSQGTAFIITKPISQEANKSRYVLVTAAHVLEKITGDRAILQLRQRRSIGKWNSIPISLKIRSGNKPLWTKHPEADVAVMYIAIPRKATVAALPMKFLAKDEDLVKYSIHPGDEVRCLGYPLGYQSNNTGFPVLRSGKIASYPLIPTKDTKTFLFDFEVFPGNSGGPVYIVETGDRIYGGSVNMATSFSYIMGLVSQQAIRIDEFKSGRFEKTIQEQTLGLGVVVHASMIRETVEFLPLP